MWTKVGWSPFAGRTLIGWPQLTFIQGKPVFKREIKKNTKGQILVNPGQTGTRLNCFN